MASRTCLTCGLALPATSRFCRNCGTSLETPMSAVDPASPPYGNPQTGYGGTPGVGMSPVPAYGGPPAFNAQAPWSSAGVWRQKNTLVMHKTATLPDRCVKCNNPANGRTLTKKYRWHHPAWALTILAGLLIYVIVALIVRKSVVLHLGLCDEHFSKRRVAIAVSWLLAALSIAMVIFGANYNSPALALLGIPLFFVAVIYGVLSANVITIKKIDDHYVWMKRINQDYLLMLPELP